MNVTYHLMPKSCTISISSDVVGNGITVTINSEDDRYPAILRAIESGHPERLPMIVSRKMKQMSTFLRALLGEDYAFKE